MTAILENENWVAQNKIIKYCALLSRIRTYEVKWNVLSQHIDRFQSYQMENDNLETS